MPDDELIDSEIYGGDVSLGISDYGSGAIDELVYAAEQYDSGDTGYTPVTIPAYDVPAYDVGTYDIGLPTPPVEQGWVANTMDFVSGAFGGVYNFLNPAPEMYTDHAAKMGYPVLGEDVLATMDPGKLALYNDNQRQLKSQFSADQNKATWNPGTWGFDQFATVIGAGIGLYQYNENQDLIKEKREADTPERQAEDQITYLQALRDAGFNSSGQALTDVEASQNSGGGAISTSNHSTNPFLT